MGENFQYDATFSDKILVLGQIGCRKISFVQSLASNKLFGNNFVKFKWLLKFNLSKSQENEIRQSFD